MRRDPKRLETEILSSLREKQTRQTAFAGLVTLTDRVIVTQAQAKRAMRSLASINRPPNDQVQP